MAKCINCNKRGLFLKLNKKGQCQECESLELKRIKEAQILKETALEMESGVPMYYAEP